MKIFYQLIVILVALGSAAHALPNAAEIIPAKGGTIRITPIYNSSFQIEWKDVVFHIDPSSSGDYSGAKKPDVILVTDTDPDHLDEKAIRNLMKSRSDDYSDYDYFRECTIYGAKAVAARLKSLEVEDDFSVAVRKIVNNVTLFQNHDEQYSIDVVPAYNIVRGSKPDQKYHPKGRGSGYILTLGGKRIYIAGDTEVTPEMKALENIDIAFLPMNPPYTMTPQEAAAGARAFKPKVVYPYHYRSSFNKTNDNPQQFANALKGSGIQVRLRGWYDHPAPTTAKRDNKTQ